MKPSVSNCHERTSQRGQAMIEFIVAASFFLVPLFLGLVVLGKFSDVQHTTTMAARYGAWERTVWYDDADTLFGSHNGANQKTAAQINSEIAVRLLNDRAQATSVIKNTDKGAASLANGVDPMWRDNAGVSYMESFSQLSSTGKKDKPTADVAGTALALIKAIPLPSAATGTIAPPVPSETLAVSTVNLLGVARNSAAYQRLWPKDSVWMVDWGGLDFSATGAILSNTWYANGAVSTKKMVEESVPMANGLGHVVGTAVSAGIKLWDPDAPSPEWGKVAPDVVPADRLK